MEKVYYTGIEAPIGTIWAASTEKGLIELHLSTPKSSFVEGLRRRAGGEPIHAPDRFNRLRSLLGRYFEGKELEFDLPLDPRGTEFQRAIWAEIHKIPHGKLSSYGRLARAVGRPRGARPAGGATGANPIGIVIPCHRVVRSDGGIGGFGSQIWMKEYLLSLEGVLPPAKLEEANISKRKYSYNKEDLRSHFYK